jgi:two-component system sensor histidine kinase BaeS
MRVRLFHQLFALVVLVALVTEIAMVTALGVNLSHTFTDYLNARDQESVRLLAKAIEAELGASGDATALEEGRLDIQRFIREAEPSRRSDGFAPPKGEEFALRQGAGPGQPQGPPPSQAPLSPLPLEPQIGVVGTGPQDPGLSRRPPPDAFGPRVIITRANGDQLWGAPAPLDRPLVKEPIRVVGHIVGYVKALPRAVTPGDIDGRFLSRQFQSAVVLGGVLLLIGALPAWFIARVASRRLEEIQSATRAVAGGDFSVRLTVAGNRELSDTISNINLMAASLERLDSARRRWLAEVSHELRTPLAALRGELEAMLDGVRPLSRVGLVSVNEEALSLSALVNDLHLLAMSDLEGPICQFVSCDAAAICRGAVERFAASAEARSIKLSLEGDVGYEWPVTWDPARMAQVLGNLISNGLQYTHAPGEIVVNLVKLEGLIVIQVDDTPPCPGVEHLPHLFESLYRADEHRSRETGGSGMGLAICEAIVRAHRGVISARPSRRGGLAIVIELPLDARRM